MRKLAAAPDRPLHDDEGSLTLAPGWPPASPQPATENPHGNTRERLTNGTALTVKCQDSRSSEIGIRRQVRRNPHLRPPRGDLAAARRSHALGPGGRRIAVLPVLAGTARRALHPVRHGRTVQADRARHTGDRRHRGRRLAPGRARYRSPRRHPLEAVTTIRNPGRCPACTGQVSRLERIDLREMRVAALSPSGSITGPGRDIVRAAGAVDSPSARSADELAGNVTQDRGIEKLAEGHSEVCSRMADAPKPNAPLVGERAHAI